MKRLQQHWTVALGVLAAAFLLMRADSSLNAADASAPANQLTEADKKLGYKLLFDGKTLAGWHSFRRKDVRPGWQVKDGTLACVDPHNAGDLVTNDMYDWFQLEFEYNISVGGNSGVMFHVTNKHGATWQTGPEVQLEDNAKATDPQRCGWLYGLYKPPIDPKTGKVYDTTKPAGEWNHMRIVIAPPPRKSFVDVNGFQYYDFVYNGDDFKKRIAKSKFRSMPDFAKSDSGFIALQGDHGTVAFRTIKLRPITADSFVP